MKGHRLAVAAMTVAVVVVSCVLVGRGQSPGQLPLIPVGSKGLAISPALEGWWKNPDGSATILIGYFNRNDTAIEIPVGPNNAIEPGGPDMGQPTHFLAGRNGGVFSITVPKDFGTKRLTWTLVSNGQSQSIALWLNGPYLIDPYVNSGNGNTPPKVRMTIDGPEIVTTPSTIAQTLEGTVGKPVALNVWVTDVGNTIVLNPFAEDRPAAGGAAAAGAADAAGRGRGRGAAGRAGGTAAGAAGEPEPAPAAAGGGGRGGNQAPIRVTWSKFRGPGEVKFEPISPRIAADGKATSSATFSSPGEYRVRAQVNDQSGDRGGGDGCCWSNVQVRVNVK
jgi:hypothetical protein